MQNVNRACLKYLHITVPVVGVEGEVVNKPHLFTTENGLKEHYISQEKQWWIEEIEKNDFSFLKHTVNDAFPHPVMNCYLLFKKNR